MFQYFPQMKIKVAASSSGSNSSSSSSGSSGSSSRSSELSVSVVEYKYPGAMRSAAQYPIELVAVLPLTYFQVKPPLSILGMLLGNPMMLIFIVVGGVMVMFPNAIKEVRAGGALESQTGGAVRAYSFDTVLPSMRTADGRKRRV